MGANKLSRTPSHEPIDKVAALGRTSLCQGLSDIVLTEIAGRAILRALRAGDILFVQHEKASFLYVVVQGQLRSVRLNHGREQVLSIDGPGAVIGAAPVLEGAELCCTEIADTDADMLSISKSDVYDLCPREPSLLWNIAKLLARTVRNQSDLIEMLALQNVDERIARYLFHLYKRQSAEVSSNSVLLDCTQAQIASRLGTTREVVCRNLAQLEKMGIIHLDGRHVTIRDEHALVRLAGCEYALLAYAASA